MTAFNQAKNVLKIIDLHRFLFHNYRVTADQKLHYPNRTMTCSKVIHKDRDNQGNTRREL